MKKRILSMLMLLVLLMTMLPTAALAADDGAIPPDNGGVTDPDMPDEPVIPIDGEGGEVNPPVQHALLTVLLKGDRNELLEGGKFELKSLTDEKLTEWTTDSEGKFVMDYYVNGTYKLIQTGAPEYFNFGEYKEYDVIVEEDGAKLSLQPFEGNESATVADVENPVEYTMKNKRMTGNLEIAVQNVYMENSVEVSDCLWIENVDATEYEVTLTITNLFEEKLNGTYGDVTITDNVAELKMKAGDSLSVSGIPAGFGYSVSVNDDGAAYVSTVAGGEGKFSATEAAAVVTNTYEYKTHNAGFNAVWVDALAPDTYPAGKLTVYSDAECATAVAELTPDANGKIHLDTAAAGSYYLKETTTPEGYHGNSEVYTITAKEETIVVNGYTEQRMVVRAEALSGTVAEPDMDEAYADNVYTVVSTPIQPVTVSIQVAWIAPEGYTNHPESVDMQLLRNGVAYGNPVTLNAENNWKTSWSGADITDNYAWTPVQVAVPEGYSEGYVSDGYAYTVENELLYSNVTVSASVSWLNPKDYTQQPVSAKLTLYRDGTAYETVTVNEAGGWVHRWKDLPDCFNWTVDEDVVPSGYKKKVTHVRNAWVVVNAHEEIPLTGDDSNVWLWAGAAGVALVGLAVTLVLLLKKRKTDNEE